jgi:hypothetical protein
MHVRFSHARPRTVRYRPDNMINLRSGGCYRRSEPYNVRLDPRDEDACMTDHPRLGRRRLLTLAALATVPAACSRSATPAAPAVAGPVPTAPPAAPPAVAAPARGAVPVARKARAGRAVAARGGPVPAVAGRAMAGSYLRLSGRSLTESLALRRSQLRRDQRIVHLFHAWADRMPTAVPEIGDSTLMISWHGTRIASVDNGSQDGVIRSAAERLAGYGEPMLLRWAWEMNGDWFPWDGSHNGDDPAAYGRAHRRIHRIFRAAGADNVAFVWSPNWNSSPAAAWNRMGAYYPGDTYVDWVGVSGYNFYRESPATLFGGVVRAFGARKPVMLAETAAIDHGGTSKARWIAALSAYVRRTPAIGAVVWFDTDVQHDSPHNFRFDTSPAALAAYRSMVRHAHFTA